MKIFSAFCTLLFPDRVFIPHLCAGYQGVGERRLSGLAEPRGLCEVHGASLLRACLWTSLPGW